LAIANNKILKLRGSKEEIVKKLDHAESTVANLRAQLDKKDKELVAANLKVKTLISVQ
jgi:hypothetical protein